MKYMILITLIAVYTIAVFVMSENTKQEVVKSSYVLTINSCRLGYDMALKDIEFTGVDTDKRLGEDKREKAKNKCVAAITDAFKKAGLK